MPDKHKATERWGGPGASHEDRTEPKPEKKPGSPTKPDHLDNRSNVSGGGGEGDKHHTHDPDKKGDRRGY
jgi:hypothetical protein